MMEKKPRGPLARSEFSTTKGRDKESAGFCGVLLSAAELVCPVALATQPLIAEVMRILHLHVNSHCVFSSDDLYT